MSKLRLGIYGGTFSPPHLGHVRAATTFVREAKLDRLLIMPDFLPPHKENFGRVSAEDRLEMCRLAFADVPHSEVSDYEVCKGGRSYTYLTLENFSAEDVDLYFLCGTDMLLTLDTWKNPESIFKLATICYVRRERDESTDMLVDAKVRELVKRFQARIFELKHDVFEVSSTGIRTDISEHTKANDTLPRAVVEYINKRGLYQ